MWAGLGTFQKVFTAHDWPLGSVTHRRNEGGKGNEGPVGGGIVNARTGGQGPGQSLTASCVAATGTANTRERGWPGWQEVVGTGAIWPHNSG